MPPISKPTVCIYICIDCSRSRPRCGLSLHLSLMHLHSTVRATCPNIFMPVQCWVYIIDEPAFISGVYAMQFNNSSTCLDKVRSGISSYKKLSIRCKEYGSKRIIPSTVMDIILMENFRSPDDSLHFKNVKSFIATRTIWRSNVM